MKKVTERFSDRVDDYAKYRPSYPDDLYRFIRQEFLKKGGPKLIADIGSGTGISSVFFLEEGHAVFGVEPNDAMRARSESLLSEYTGYRAVKGKAEGTTLIDGICDLVFCAQSFHWFDVKSALKEFKRILAKNGKVLLVWNDRNTDDSPFSKEYEEFIKRHAIDYESVNHKRIDLKFLKQHIPQKIESREFPNSQELDEEGLMGRVLSSSYMPRKNDEGYTPMAADLKELFTRHSFGGKVTITYTTRLYYFTVNEK